MEELFASMITFFSELQDNNGHTRTKVAATVTLTLEHRTAEGLTNLGSMEDLIRAGALWLI